MVKSGYVVNVERIRLKKEFQIKMKILLDNKVIRISAADRITTNEFLKLRELVNVRLYGYIFIFEFYVRDGLFYGYRKKVYN